MITLRKLSKVYPGAARPAVDGIDLTVARGEFLVLIGPSGCGKTTTLTMINRLEEPSSGEIEIDGTDVRSVDPVALRRRIGFVFQDVGLFPHLSAGNNAGITLQVMGQPASEIAARTNEVLEQVRLPAREYRDRYPAMLSGGQRQRVGVARALAAKPSIMLMDEPFGALDPLVRDDLASDYREIHDSLGLTTLLVTHDMTEAFLLADRIAVMREGRLIQAATPRELIAAPADDFVRSMIESPRKRARALAEVMRANEIS
jgi:osmoprotectant transport system ATP-binding protein